jgi:hypothetical protein
MMTVVERRSGDDAVKRTHSPGHVSVKPGGIHTANEDHWGVYDERYLQDYGGSRGRSQMDRGIDWMQPPRLEPPQSGRGVVDAMKPP